MPVTNLKPSRFPNGLTLGKTNSLFGDYVFPENPLIAHKFFDDFDNFSPNATYSGTTPTASAAWTIEATSTGTIALESFDGGALRITTAASNNDIQAIVKAPVDFVTSSSKMLWFGIGAQLSAASASVFQAGIIAGTPFTAISDGWYINKANAATTTITFLLRAGSATVFTRTITLPTALANATNFTMGFCYIPAPGRGQTTSGGQVFFFYNDVMIDTFTVTSTIAAAFPTAAIGPYVGVRAVAAAAISTGVDWILACEQR